MTAPIILTIFAVLVATLGPRLLRSTDWPERSPRMGIIAWQATTASVVLAVVLIGVALALPTIPVTASVAELIEACTLALRAQYSTPAGAALSGAGVFLSLAVMTRVGYCLAAGLATAGLDRRRQLQALALVARRHGCQALVVDHPTAVAYCLPGRRQEIVLTTAALAALDEGQVAAVLAHEQAHLSGRHDLVLAAACALDRAFPRVPAFRAARDELARLIEMLADDAAAARSDRLTVATALVQLSGGSAPAAALGAGGRSALARVRRLVAPARPLGAPRSALAALAAAAVLTAPVAVAAAPAAMAATTDFCPISFPVQPL